VGKEQAARPPDKATWRRSHWSLGAFVSGAICLAFAVSLHIDLVGLIAIAIALIALRRGEPAAISALVATVALLICGLVLSAIS
jgi:hypothetical protein